MNRCEEVLAHHGVKGQKWGVRRYQNPDGTLTKAGRERYLKDSRDFILKKGHKISRVSLTKDDVTRNGRKYVSTNQEDQDIWEKEIGEGFKNMGYETYNVNYKTKKDLKVMSSVNQGKLFIDMILNDKNYKEQSIEDFKNITKQRGQYAYANSNDPSSIISIQIASNTKTAQKFIDKVLEKGYDAVVDTYGQDTAKEPIIILNPDDKLKSVGKSKPTKAVTDYQEQKKKEQRQQKIADLRESIESIERDIDFYKEIGEKPKELESLKRKYEKEIKKLNK